MAHVIHKGKYLYDHYRQDGKVKSKYLGKINNQSQSIPEEYDYRVDVFKGFAKNKKDFLKEVRNKNNHTMKWLNAHRYDISKIRGDMIEIDRGRYGNWNDYVKKYGKWNEQTEKYEGIKVKKGENWYEFSLIVDKIPKKQ